MKIMSSRNLLRSLALIFVITGGLIYLYHWSVWYRYRDCIYGSTKHNPEVCKAIQASDTPSPFLWYGLGICAIGGVINTIGERRYGKRKIEPLPIKPAYLIHSDLEHTKKKGTNLEQRNQSEEK